MTTATAIDLTANPIYAAGGLRMMAKHLLDTIDPKTAHFTRLIETCDEAEALLRDARTLSGDHQEDAATWRICADYRRRIVSLEQAANG